MKKLVIFFKFIFPTYRRYIILAASEFIKKNESHIINRKDDDKFANEESNDCSEEFSKSIYKYLFDAKYPDKIISIKFTKKRNEIKSKFHKLVTSCRRFKIKKSENKIK